MSTDRIHCRECGNVSLLRDGYISRYYRCELCFSGDVDYLSVWQNYGSRVVLETNGRCEHGCGSRCARAADRGFVCNLCDSVRTDLLTSDLYHNLIYTMKRRYKYANSFDYLAWGANLPHLLRGLVEKTESRKIKVVSALDTVLPPVIIDIVTGYVSIRHI